MATTYNHCQIAIVDASGNVSVIYPITQAQDVSVVRTSNANLPTTVTTAQKLANALGALAFKNVADIISTDGTATSNTKTWASSVINTKLTELSSNLSNLYFESGKTNADMYTVGNWGSGEVNNLRWICPVTGLYYLVMEFRSLNLSSTNYISQFQLHIKASIDAEASWFTLDGAIFGSCSERIDTNMFVRNVTFFGYCIKDAIIKPYIHAPVTGSSAVMQTQLFWTRTQTC